MSQPSDLTPLRAKAMEVAHTGIVITDATHPDNPIIDCNPAFEVITGYPRNEVLGRNCRFLQGPDIDPRTIEDMRKAIKSKRHITVVIKNYRKDGSMFWNELSISPIFDDAGKLTNFMGIQNNATVRETARLELAHQNSELSEINVELLNKSRQQIDIDKKINDLLLQSHSHREY